jgi:hypothetical protein
LAAASSSSAITLLVCAAVCGLSLIAWPASYVWSYEAYIGWDRGTSGVGFDVRTSFGFAPEGSLGG